MAQKITNLELVSYLLELYKSDRAVYWYGTYGQQCSTALYKRKKAQYPKHYTSNRTARYLRDIKNNKLCMDCIGLIKGAVWSNLGTRKPVYASNGCPDKSANGMLAYCKSKGMRNGKMSTMPETPGIMLHKDGHVGVYIGNGYAIEAQGFSTDIVRTKVKGRGWKQWTRMPFITYKAGTVAMEEYALGDRILSIGNKGEDVLALQNPLKMLGFAKGAGFPDGNFGPITQAALIAFQKRVGLTDDGVFDSFDYDALMDALKNGLPAIDENDGAPDDGCAHCPDPEEEQEPDNNPDDDATGSVAQYVRATGYLNVRSEPNTSATILSLLKKGAKLPYAGTTKDGWHEVMLNDATAWVSGKYSRLVEAQKLVIDLSQYNTVTDWDLVTDNVAFLWLRVGLRSKAATGPIVLDAKVFRYAAECAKREIPFGLYFFGRAGTKAAAVEEADATAQWGEPLNPTVYAYNAEVAAQTHDSIQAFVDRLSNLTGRPVGAYIAHHRYKEFHAETLKLAYVWIPRYGSTDGTIQVEPDYPHDVHQYSSRVKVPGIEGNVDGNHISGTGKTLEWFQGKEPT